MDIIFRCGFYRLGKRQRVADIASRIPILICFIYIIGKADKLCADKHCQSDERCRYNAADAFFFCKKGIALYRADNANYAADGRYEIQAVQRKPAESARKGKEKCTEKPENNAPGALGFVLSR